MFEGGVFGLSLGDFVEGELEEGGVSDGDEGRDAAMFFEEAQEGLEALEALFEDAPLFAKDAWVPGEGGHPRTAGEVSGGVDGGEVIEVEVEGKGAAGEGFEELFGEGSVFAFALGIDVQGGA